MPDAIADTPARQKAAMYDLERIVILRQALLDQVAEENRAIGMNVDQARIHAEMTFAAWEHNLLLDATKSAPANEREDGELREAFNRGAREGWMRCGVYHIDLDFEGEKELVEIDKRWPLTVATPSPPQEVVVTDEMVERYMKAYDASELCMRSNKIRGALTAALTPAHKPDTGR